MDFASVCRTCLASDSLHPIFMDEINHQRYSTAVFITTGIKVDLRDGLPQNMCTNCINHLNESLVFRKKCRETEIELTKMKNNLETGQMEAKITLVDENKLKSIWYPEGDVKLENKLENINVKINNNVQTKSEDEGYNSSVKKLEYTKPMKSEVNDDTDDDDKPLSALLDAELESDNDIKELEAYSDDKFNLENDNYVLELEKRIKTRRRGTVTHKKFMKIQHLEDYLEISLPITEQYTLEEINSDQSNKRITCNLCQKSLSVRSIDSHMACRHPGADEKRVKCELCDKYILREKLNRHNILMHGVCDKGVQSNFKCSYCKDEFAAKASLVEHVASCPAKKKRRRVSEKGREMRECEVCHKVMQRASLRMHEAIKHAGLGPVCEHCGKKFGNKFRLNEHCRAKHGYEKFKCSFCEFQSAGVMAMRNHERRHRGEKPFVCESCGAKFHAAYLLAQHKQSHRTEKLLKCDLCSAKFKANNSLHMHKITCHSKCLFKCFLCDRTYSCRHYVVKHLRQFHDYREKVGHLERIYELGAERGREE